ncbi:response regulator transcription factor [Ruficoccus amylovorans]|uniref:Response regulator transcription factor n=1 Tax=Ruficoccus amylovorans TaxID=1804625 RepID=A0A842HJE3_9BACT|nr:response regulator transcription factor [Ruficoccus amylovorans]MBC2595281.1 response regulator transcription factor [Ruficoccus amylovorans]
MNDATPIKVWIVEDDSMFRNGLMRALGRRKELDCEVGFSSHEDMFKYAEAGNAWPDVVLMDIELVGASGLVGIRKLCEVAPNVRTLILTVFSSREKLYDAIDAGASGYLLKRSSVSEIVRGIQDVLDGETVLDNQVIKYILDNAKRGKDSQIKLAPKEQEVVRQLSLGHTVVMVADAMNISTHTVDTYIRRIYKKMGVHSQSAAVARAMRDNLL